MNKQVLSMFAAVCAMQLAFVSPARAEEANLVGVFDILSVDIGNPPTQEGFNLVFYYGELDAELGMNMADISADGMLGGTGANQNGSTEFIHFDVSNSQNFARFIEHLTNDVEDEMWCRGIHFDSNGVITSIGSPHQLLEQFGLNSRFGAGTITFAKYVRGMSAGAGSTTSLQFFSGDPKIDGGAQSADVDQFITFAWPLEKTTTWYWSSKGTLGITITYGATINPATFQATLDREPLTGFHPVAGTTEVVYIPVTPGRSTLVISVEGTKPSGASATDTDRLTIIGI